MSYMKANSTTIAVKLSERLGLSRDASQKAVSEVMKAIRELVLEGYDEIDLQGVATLKFKMGTPKRYFNVVTQSLEEGKPRVKVNVRVKHSLKEALKDDERLKEKLF